MAGSMRMDFAGASQCKSGLDNGARALSDAMANLDNVIANLEQVWEGDSSRRFVEDYRNTLKKNLTGVFQAVEQTANELQTDINNWTQLDQRG